MKKEVKHDKAARKVTLTRLNQVEFDKAMKEELKGTSKSKDRIIRYKKKKKVNKESGVSDAALFTMLLTPDAKINRK